MNEKILEELAKVLYSQWKEEKLSQEFHHPTKCPNFEKIDDSEDLKIIDDVIHCNKCLASLIDYESLSEYQKKSYNEKAKVFLLALNTHNLNLTEIIK